ncbi:MAG: hypothetical protein BWY29_00705 [Microgenomates group bacterium ADurb.Bin238]|nr:MAG: hypothetical protein BWY29_00705 [Microgenomates group bacterium ADurb.Bin238]
MNEDGIDQDILTEAARRHNRRIYSDVGDLIKKKRAEREEEAKQVRTTREQSGAQIDEFVAQQRERQAQWKQDVEQNTGPVTTNTSSPEEPEIE